ncbi:hypothetical protein AMS68_004038 [Peltaster fructicola]|uniref:CPAF-like PDZ domain-containing protein n=1 Tax=Peltaster fructicola TaxID=286661 RepID=A0A6H0XV40_9PEZI|nr:hypothetical protein AMS68_004038 [Peltaster fructicola]
MAGNTFTLALTALLVSSVEARFRGWGPFSHPGWLWPSVYEPPQPENTHPGWPGFPSVPYTTHTTALTTTTETTKTGITSRTTPASGLTTSISYKTSLSGSSASIAPSRSSSHPSVSGSLSLTTSRSRASGSASSSAPAPSGSGLSPCASISKLIANFTRVGTAIPTVPAKLGLDCLNSIPFNQSAAVAFVDSIRPYLEWQTTIEYLKDPPAEYAEKIQPAYDFRADYERIYNNAVSGAYTSEYAFGTDLYTAFQRAHDGHFVVYPDSVASLITFGRQTPLVSVSLDGQSIPQVYAYSDVLAASFGNASFTPSALTQINGQDSTTYLLQYAQLGSLQDRDALWNNVFYELAQVALGSAGTGTGTFAGSGRGRFFYPGPDTTLTFENGTSVTTPNFARILVPFTNITSGADLYRKFLAVPSGEPKGALELATATPSTISRSVGVSSTRLASSATLSSRSSTRAASSVRATATTSQTSLSIPAPGYPSPLVREPANLNSGYFLQGEGYDDVAVLAVNSFVSTLADEIPFQSVNTYTINQAVAQNKTKLIIDVSANGGGTILQGYDLFKQLFPGITPWGGQRFRAHEAIDIIGQEFSAYSAGIPRTESQNQTALDVLSSPFNYRTDLDADYKQFTSWAEKYGPHAYGPQPDNFTSLLRWNLSDPLILENSGGIYVSGYLNRSNITVQPFKAENIIVVTDGYCASTCTIFSELMRQQGGVKFVSLGGRPNKNITQAVGGVKGTNDIPYLDLLSYVEQVFETPLLNSRQFYNTTVLGQYNDLFEYRSTAAVINSRDGLRQGDASQTPLQFLYEPSDCRIYYTPEMTVDISASWRAVADSAWNGVNHCVAGSLGATGEVQKRALHERKRHSSAEKRDLLESVDNIFDGQGHTFSGDSVMII